jgi:hypothetical protein
MDRKTFDKHKADCKAGWEQLAHSGSPDKPNIIGKYDFGCPACAIAIMANREIKGNPTSHELNCRVCPVDRWRNAALTSPISCDGGTYHGTTGCESLDPGGPWDRWKLADHYSSKRKINARLIAGLRWTYLKIYSHPQEDER